MLPAFHGLWVPAIPAATTNCQQNLDNPQTAKTWLAKLRQRAKRAVDTLLTGPIVSEFGRPDHREVFQGNYRVVYRIADDSLTILTVIEGHRLLKGID